MNYDLDVYFLLYLYVESANKLSIYLSIYLSVMYMALFCSYPVFAVSFTVSGRYHFSAFFSVRTSPGWSSSTSRGRRTV